MVDAARQMLDELMGRNRNLHPSEAAQKVNWEDPDFCQYYIVKFCPHELFVNTRADLGPCNRLHDDEARKMYEEAKASARKRHYEDEFLRFCNTMLNDVDRKIQKGKQRLQLMNKDKPAHASHLTRYQDQLNNFEAKIKKLLTEAEEAGIRGDVDQAQDLMVHCEQLREERDAFVAQNEIANNKALADADQALKESSPKTHNVPDEAENNTSTNGGDSGSGVADGPEESMDSTTNTAQVNEINGEKKTNSWLQESTGIMNEKQMEVCETCGAFLIVGDAQQRIEDHLMGKQHLGYSKLRQAVTEIHEKRKKDREDDDRRRRNDRSQRSSETERRREYRDRDQERDLRAHSREHSSRHSSERHHRHHATRDLHSRRSRSRSPSQRHRHNTREQRGHRRRSHSRSRSRY